jgi:hypothetical protein
MDWDGTDLRRVKRSEPCAFVLLFAMMQIHLEATTFFFFFFFGLFGLTITQAHVFASVFGTVCKSCADKSAACRHAKVKFNSTSNSKRRVHVMLFWRRALGPNFPISDILLQDNVWRQLDSCRFGIK